MTSREDVALHWGQISSIYEEASILRRALQEVAGLPSPERNPDGVDQSADTMRMIAQDALERCGLDVHETDEKSRYTGTFCPSDPVESGAQNGPRAARTAEGQEHQEGTLMNGSESTAERCRTHAQPSNDGGEA